MRADMYTLKPTEHVHFSSSFLNRFFLNTHTLLCKPTWPVNEHPNFCNQPRGVQIQDFMTTKLWMMVPNKSFWILDIEFPSLSPCCQPQFWGSCCIFSISMHPCYPISFLPLLANMLLPSSNTSSLDPTIVSLPLVKPHIKKSKCSASTFNYNINHIKCHIPLLQLFLTI
jgi:hypothetical protein